MNLDLMTQSRTPCTRGMRYHVDGLAVFRHYCEHLGNPQNRMGKIVHIAGTNGKGSTALYIAEMFQQSGLKVGVFSSPHYRSWSERITVQGKMIDTLDLEGLLERLVQDPVLAEVTPFEQLTLAAFLYFERESVDVAVIETGIGGLLDATNVVMSHRVVLTPISMDHADILGDSLVEIAQQKAGIVQSNCPVFSARQTEEVMAVLSQVASEKESNLYVKAVDDQWRACLRVLPRYLQDNSYLAWQVAQSMCTLSFSEAIECVRRVVCPGRFSVHRVEAATIVCDAAHNMGALRQLLSVVHDRFKGKDVHFVLGIQRSRPVVEMVRAVLNSGYSCSYCEFDLDYATPFDVVAQDCSVDEWGIPFSFSGSKVYVLAGSIYFLARFYDQFPELWMTHEAI